MWSWGRSPVTEGFHLETSWCWLQSVQCRHTLSSAAGVFPIITNYCNGSLWFANRIICPINLSGTQVQNQVNGFKSKHLSLFLSQNFVESKDVLMLEAETKWVHWIVFVETVSNQKFMRKPRMLKQWNTKYSRMLSICDEYATLRTAEQGHNEGYLSQIAVKPLVCIGGMTPTWPQPSTVEKSWKQATFSDFGTKDKVTCNAP